MTPATEAQENADIRERMDRMNQHKDNLPAPVQRSDALVTLIDRVLTDPGIDVAKLEQLLLVKERWDAEEARKSFEAAISAWALDPPQIVKNHHVQHRGGNYSYASLGDFASEIRRSMAPHGLSFRWSTGTAPNGDLLVGCTLVHHDGHSDQVSISGPPDDTGAKNKIQQVGSSLTYLQRYTLLAITGLVAEEDTDGQGRPPAQPTAPNSNGDGKQSPRDLGTCEWQDKPFTDTSASGMPIHREGAGWCNGLVVAIQGGEIISERYPAAPAPNPDPEPCRHPAVEVVDGQTVCMNCGRSWQIPKAEADAGSSASQAAGPQSSATADRPTGPDADDCEHLTVEDDGYCNDCFRHVGFGYCEQEGCIGKGSAWLREKDGTRFHDIPGGQHVERAEEGKERADDIPF